MSENKGQRFHKNKSFFQSLRNAGAGWITALQTERNMRSHLVSAILVFVAGLAFSLTASEWLWIALAVPLVFMSELVNTIVECLVDLVVGSQIHSLARDAKDMAATVVVFASLFAVVVAAFIFIPKLLHLF